MKLPRILPPLALLAALAAPAASAGEAWDRELQFVAKLCNRRYFDIADQVLARLEADDLIIGIKRAKLSRSIAEFYAGQAPSVAIGKDRMKRYLEYLDKSRGYYLKYLDHPAIKDDRKLGGERFNVRLRLSWLSLSVADGHMRFRDDPDMPKAEKDAHKVQARTVYQSGVEEFRKAVQDKAAEVKDLERNEPKPGTTDKEWHERFDAARNEYFAVSLLYAEARIRFAKFLQDIKAPDTEIQGVLQATAKDMVDLRMHSAFRNRPGALAAQLTMAIALFEQGATKDKETEERLDDIWGQRAAFRQKRIPCEAAFWKAQLLVRQKRAPDALKTLDELLKYRSPNNVWGQETKTVQGVREFLEVIERDDREDFDQAATAGAFLLEAEVYAALAQQAEKERKSPKEVRGLYATAYDFAAGVREANVAMDHKYPPLIEEWRRKGNRPKTLLDLDMELKEAIRAKNWGESARLQSAIIVQSNPPADRLREAWSQVATFYFFGKRYYEAYLAFTAVARWFPGKDRERARQFAVIACQEQLKISKGADSEKFDKELLERARRELEEDTEEGAGPLVLKDGIKAREAGRLDEALRLFGQVQPKSPFYADALYQTVLARKAIFESLPKGERTTLKGKQALQALEASFAALDDYYTKRLPEVKDDEHAEERKHLVLIAGAGLAVQCSAYLEDYALNPAKILGLTTDFEKKYPGIETAPSYGVLYYCRMRAAYTLHETDSARAEKHLATLEETWDTLRKKCPTFPFIDKAAAMGATVYTHAATRLEGEAKEAKDPAAKKALLERAQAAKNRSLDFWLQLVEANEKQPLTVFRFILWNLYHREVVPRSNDFRKLVELAPKIIEMFEDQPAATAAVMDFKAMLGLSYAQLQKHAEALSVLEEVENTWETTYQTKMKKYETAKKEWDGLTAAQKRKKQPPAPPTRPTLHPEVKLWLCKEYLAANARDKYAKAAPILLDLCALFPTLRDPKEQAKYWDALHLLCETYRRQGDYDDAVKQISRIAILDPELGGRESKARFVELLRQLRQDLERAANVKQRDQLLRQVDEVLKTLSK